MALDILNGFPGWTPIFQPVYRQESSRTANGVTYWKDLGSPIWKLRAVSRRMSPNELDRWRARLEELRGAGELIKGYSLSRTYPILYPNGINPVSTPTINSVNGDGTKLSITGLPANYGLRYGDMFRVGTADLYRVLEDVTASAGGLTTEFKVGPMAVWPGTGPGDAVSFVRPYCLMAVNPASITTDADAATGRGSVAFEAMESRDAA